MSSRAHGRWLTVAGRLVQEKPFFTANPELALDAEGRRAFQRLAMVDDTTRFELALPAETARLKVDPDHHLLRRLDRRKSRRP